MSHTTRRATIAGLIAVAVLTISTAAVADDGIDTVPADYEFGQHASDDDWSLDGPETRGGRVDERSRYNPLAGRNIGWSSGYIAPAGTVTLTNRLVYGQRLDVSVADGVQLFGEGFLPLGSQTYLSAGGQVRVAGDDSYSATVGAQGRYRRTNFSPGTADAGAVVNAVIDVIATDDTSWNVGLAVHMPVYQVVEDIDFAGCDTRRQWAESSCGTMELRSRWAPPSGWWGALYGGVNHFVTDWLMVNAELFTGVSQGNFWALESALNPELAYDSERQLVEQTQFSAGLGPLGIVTLGLGTTVSVGRVAVQPSVYLTNYRGDAQILPWLSAAIRLW